VSEIVSIDKETAEKEFDRLCESWHIELDDNEGEEGGKTLRNSIVTNLVKGRLVVREASGSIEGETYKLVVHQNLREPCGDKLQIIHKFIKVDSLLTLDGIKKDDNNKRMVACVSAVSREGAPHVRQMCVGDLYAGMMVASLFLVP